MTYLEIVNKVLKRLREQEVTTVSQNAYSALIGEFVNDVKREVEDAWNWSALRTTFTVSTTANLFNYVFTDAGTRIRVLDVWDDTNNYQLQERSTKWFNENFQSANGLPTPSKPSYYNFNGVDSNGDIQVDLFPIPDGAYDLRFNIISPQADLSADADTITVPSALVIEGAVSRAMSERGADGGNTDAEMRYRQRLADYIAIDAGFRTDELTWNSN